MRYDASVRPFDVKFKVWEGIQNAVNANIASTLVTEHVLSFHHFL